MSTFLYKGFTSEGTKVGGAKNFSNAGEMEKYAKELGIEGVEVFESKTKFTTTQYRYVDPKELSIFCKQMSVVFFSYITLMEGILMLADQSDNEELKTALTEIHDLMDKGYTFAETIAMYDHIFGRYLIKMIFIGEASGNLDVIFADMSSYYEKENNIRKKIKAAITYPVTLSIMMLAIIVFLVRSILPMFDSMLTSMGAAPSLVTGSIIAITEFFNTYGIIFLLGFVAVVVGLNFYFKTEKGSFALDKLKTKLPGVKYITARVITTRFARSLAILLKSGIQVVSAIEQSIVLVDNTYLNKKFVTAYEKIKDGEDLANTLEEIGIFPNLFIKMIIIGQSTGNLDVMLDKSSNLFEDEVDDAIDRTTRLIEPILITILSLIVGIILLAVMLPMINIMQYI